MKTYKGKIYEEVTWPLIDLWVRDVGYQPLNMEFSKEKRWFNNYRLSPNCRVEDFFDLVCCKGGDCAN